MVSPNRISKLDTTIGNAERMSLGRMTRKCVSVGSVRRSILKRRRRSDKRVFGLGRVLHILKGKEQICGFEGMILAYICGLRLKDVKVRI